MTFLQSFVQKPLSTYTCKCVPQPFMKYLNPSLQQSDQLQHLSSLLTPPFLLSVQFSITCWDSASLDLCLFFTHPRRPPALACHHLCRPPALACLVQVTIKRLAGRLWSSSTVHLCSVSCGWPCNYGSSKGSSISSGCEIQPAAPHGKGDSCCILAEVALQPDYCWSCCTAYPCFQGIGSKLGQPMCQPAVLCAITAANLPTQH